MDPTPILPQAITLLLECAKPTAKPPKLVYPAFTKMTEWQPLLRFSISAWLLGRTQMHYQICGTEMLAISKEIYPPDHNIHYSVQYNTTMTNPEDKRVVSKG